MSVSLLTGNGSLAAAVACRRWPFVTAATGFLADKPEQMLRACKYLPIGD